MKKAFTTVEIFIVIAIVGLIIAIAVPAFYQNHHREELYQLWVRHTGNPGNLTYEEWNKLKSSNLLTQGNR
jgi:hypothetical protein